MSHDSWNRLRTSVELRLRANPPTAYPFCMLSLITWTFVTCRQRLVQPWMHAMSKMMSKGVDMNCPRTPLADVHSSEHFLVASRSWMMSKCLSLCNVSVVSVACGKDFFHITYITSASQTILTIPPCYRKHASRSLWCLDKTIIKILQKTLIIDF